MVLKISITVIIVGCILGVLLVFTMFERSQEDISELADTISSDSVIEEIELDIEGITESENEYFNSVFDVSSRAEVIGVSFRQGQRTDVGYIIVKFDKPISVEGNIELEVYYPWYETGVSVGMPLLTTEFPSDTLTFGTVDYDGGLVVFSIKLVGSNAFIGGSNDNLNANIAFYPIIIGNSNYTYNGIQVLDQNIVACVSWLESLGSRVDSVILNELSSVIVDYLDDEDRKYWAYHLRNISSRELDVWNFRGVGLCRDLWSEEVNDNNKEKRNREYYKDCIYTKDSVGMRPQQSAIDVASVVTQPYMDLSFEERVVYRQFLAKNSSCHKLYPQLFYDRWIPIDDEWLYVWEEEGG